MLRIWRIFLLTAIASAVAYKFRESLRTALFASVDRAKASVDGGSRPNDISFGRSELPVDLPR